MSRRSGSFITNNPSFLTSNTAVSGIWPISEASQAKGTSKWPDVGSPIVPLYPYTVSNSLRLRKSASAYLKRQNPSSGGNSTQWTLSVWVKRGSLNADSIIASGFTSPDNNGAFNLYFDSSNRLGFGAYSIVWRITTQVFRDTSAWYHIVAVWDSNNATSGNRVKLYVNGNEITTFDTTNNPSLGQSNPFCANDDGSAWSGQNIISATRSIGSNAWYQVLTLDGYIAEINCVQGQALTPSSFGETNSTTGTWIPKQYTGAYGTNGFYLKFNNGSSTTTLGYDASGNSNNWTTNNISLTSGATYDWMLDSPTPVSSTVGNYAVLNPISNLSTGSTITNGNLQVATVSSGDCSIPSTIGMSDGKYYAEFIVTSSASSAMFGLIPANYATGTAVGYNANSVGLKSSGNLRNKGISTDGWSTTWTTNDVMAIAFDASAGTVDFYKNNVKQNSTLTGFTSGPYFFAVSDDGSATSETWIVNFGQRPFAYTPPTGYKALQTYNFPTPTIQKGSLYFDTTLYTGTGSSQSITNSGFQPDLVWTKSRSNAYFHGLWDSVRGATKKLSSNSTNAEITDADGITSFNSTGFTLGSDAGINGSGATFVGWQWKAGGTAVTNTNGSITSQVSANPTAGFSVVTYTGNGATDATVGHGLGIAPYFIIVKNRSTTTDWVVYHQSLPSWDGGNYAHNSLKLNTTDALSNIYGLWNNSTSTLFTISDGQTTAGDRPKTNANGNTYVAYCWAPINGYSSFGSYTGNGNADGPFMYLGFRPKWIIVRGNTSGNYWTIYDTSRNTYNIVGSALAAQAADAEYSYSGIDCLSNGFKIRTTGGDLNTSSNPYYYAAFAENPFAYSNAR